MNDKLKKPEMDEMFNAILTLKTTEECYDFFEDLCTIKELLSMSQRFAVALMLKQDKTYVDIAKETGASTATISRVNRSLEYGNDGYDIVIRRLKNQEN